MNNKENKGRDGECWNQMEWHGFGKEKCLFFLSEKAEKEKEKEKKVDM